MAKRFRFGRRRSFPLEIHRLGGAGLGSGTFFGTRVSDLTDAFNGFRDEEAFQRLADGDPESFIAYAEKRMSSLLGPARETLKGYVERAKEKITTDKADAAAIEKYTRTNDHEEYLDYLVKRLDKTSDAAARNRIENNILELRSRINKATSGGAAATVGKTGVEELVKARQKFDAAKLAVEKKLRQGSPISDKELEDLNEAAAALSVVLLKIESDPGVRLSTRQDARSERLGPKGPELYPVNAVETNDTKLMAEAGLDAPGRSLFESSLATAPTGAERARLLVDRAGVIDLILSGVRSDDQRRVVVGELVKTEDRTKALLRELTGPRDLPESAERDLDALYQEYVVAQRTLGNPTVTPTEFRRAAREALNSADFSATVRYVGEGGAAGDIGAEFFTDVQGAVRAGAPATFDFETGDFAGSPEAVADTRAAADLARRLDQMKTGIYADLGASEGRARTLYDYFRLARGERIGAMDPRDVGPGFTENRPGGQPSQEPAEEPIREQEDGRLGSRRFRPQAEFQAGEDRPDPQFLADQFLSGYEPPGLPEDRADPFDIGSDLFAEEEPEDDLTALFRPAEF